MEKTATIEVKGEPGSRCFAAQDDEEFCITWCTVKGHNQDLNTCVCNGFLNPGCPAKPPIGFTEEN